MARSTNDDRSDSENPGDGRDKEDQHSRANPLDSHPQEHGGGQTQQQQVAPDRDFAPGEDGECH